jgi:lycopene beta-cyclase
MRMLSDPFFSNQKILVIDQSPKTANDRTWCFWEKEAGLFEPIVYHRWQQLNFFSKNYSATMNIAPYQYKMIRGIDFYDYVREESKQHPNVEWRYEKVNTVYTEKGRAIIETTTQTITCDFLFNSILFNRLIAPPPGSREVLLLQHFKGWIIETDRPCFDACVATFMDFRVSQEQGTTFVYLMPLSATTALVEFTLFTEKLLDQNSYETALKQYIKEQLSIDSYNIIHEEFGIIPMTNKRFSLHDGNIIHMGIAGGQVKGSSGYAFRFIQKRTAEIVAAIKETGRPFSGRSFANRKFLFYDSVMLHVLQKRKMEGMDIFSLIFQKNPPARVFRFLDNETGMMDDLKIMSSVPSAIFLPEAIQELFS